MVPTPEDNRLPREVNCDDYLRLFPLIRSNKEAIGISTEDSLVDVGHVSEVKDRKFVEVNDTRKI